MAVQPLFPELPAWGLAAGLAALPADRFPAVLDSSGVGHLGSHLLIAGFDPVRRIEIESDAAAVLQALSDIDNCGLAAIFTLSYDFGDALVRRSGEARRMKGEPFISVSLFDRLIIHDYTRGETWVAGDTTDIRETTETLGSIDIHPATPAVNGSPWTSNFSRNEYLAAIETIQEYIRRGDTYQANLTQQITARLGEGDSAAAVFARLRREHPAPFAAFIQRDSSTVVSASPERFFSAADGIITASPIKGTRRRGLDAAEDERARAGLLDSAKDRAENTMIVDLLRNDLGRICDFGSVRVEKLCDLEEHPSLFHLVSTISGRLRPGTGLSEIIKATFPCGSITGAPKVRTMELIDEIEPGPRGLSMGAIGYRIPAGKFGFPNARTDLSVAIRTMVIRDGTTVFNVGGGIVIDSDPASEYDESLLKAGALLRALGCRA